MNASAARGQHEAPDTVGFVAYIPSMTQSSRQVALTRIFRPITSIEESIAALRNVSGKVRAILMTKTALEDTA